MRRVPAREREELAAMRRAGRVVAEMHESIRAELRPGITTGRLDEIARDVLARRGATSNFLGYHGYPAVICASVNDQVVHGIPGNRFLEDGDVISIDCGAIVDGWHGDAAFTAGVGTISAEAERLIELTEQALDAAIRAMVAGNRVGDVSAAVEQVGDRHGLGIVDGFGGHGIGRAMHEDPDVPNYGRPGRGPKLDIGSVLAIEPMFVLGDPDVVVLEDGWTVVTRSGAIAAHAEHTVAVTADGPEILTRA
ncbi:MAG: type I methionyl aminopeptidase [Ilumatobacteraceae bacterium]